MMWMPDKSAQAWRMRVSFLNGSTMNPN